MHLILSPHFDDAVLSAGGQIRQRVETGEAVQVLTLFAGRPGPALSPLARELHRRWGDPPDPIGLRQAEDEAALALLGAVPRRLDLSEALYRRDPEGAWLYPTRETLFGAIHPAEEARPAALAEAVAGFLPAGGEVTVQAPLGVGGHVDHRLAHAAARHLMGRGIAVWFYEDYPYAARPGELDRTLAALDGLRLQPRLFPLTEAQLAARIAAIGAYRTQVAGLFRDAPSPEEAVRRHARETGGGEPAERLWIPGEES